MSRFFSINKVSLTASVCGLASVWLTGFVIFRPNRLLLGEPLFLTETLGGNAAPVLMAWSALVILSVFRLPDRLVKATAGPLAVFLIPFSIVIAARHADLVFNNSGPIARVSLGPAFWISLFSLAIIISEAWRRSRLSRNLTAMAAIVATAALFWFSMDGRFAHLSLVREFLTRRSRFLAELETHLILVAAAVTLSIIIGIPLGILTHRRAKVRAPVFFTLNSLQTIPSLALFGILIPVLAALTAGFPFLERAGVQAIGTTPALIALTVYSLLPVARNTYTGFNAVDPGIVEAGRGMGMTGRQLLYRVEFPIASPIILSGVRIAFVQAVGLTAVAALIGAGGLGVFIFQGLGQAATDLILLGAIPTILIAVIADGLSSGLAVLLKPGGLG